MDSYMILSRALAEFGKEHVDSAFSPFSAVKLVQHSWNEVSELCVDLGIPIKIGWKMSILPKNT